MKIVLSWYCIGIVLALVQDENSLLQVVMEPVLDGGEEVKYDTHYDGTKPCTSGVYFADGPKIVTDKDVTIWLDKEEWGALSDDNWGISADDAAACEAFCLEFEECSCFVFDVDRQRCNLKKGCSGKTGPRKLPAPAFEGYYSCMLERPPKSEMCTDGPDGKPCQNGCEAHGKKPACTCGAPGKLGPVPGFEGPWCEKTDECSGKGLGATCGSQGICEKNKRGLMKCVPKEKEVCTKKGASCGEGKICKKIRGKLRCRNKPLCAGKKAGESCGGAGGRICRKNKRGRLNCRKKPHSCHGKKVGVPCAEGKICRKNMRGHKRCMNKPLCHGKQIGDPCAERKVCRKVGPRRIGCRTKRLCYGKKTGDSCGTGGICKRRGKRLSCRTRPTPMMKRPMSMMKRPMSMMKRP